MCPEEPPTAPWTMRALALGGNDLLDELHERAGTWVEDHRPDIGSEYFGTAAVHDADNLRDVRETAYDAHAEGYLDACEAAVRAAGQVPMLTPEAAVQALGEALLRAGHDPRKLHALVGGFALRLGLTEWRVEVAGAR